MFVKKLKIGDNMEKEKQFTLLKQENSKSEKAEGLKRYRKPRIWYPNVMYHITSRGNRKSDIFREKEDYEIYIKILKKSIKDLDNQYEILSYCLMTNHVHLQIKTKDTHIKNLMMKLNKLYADYFNNKYKLVGHLFQSRYGSEIIEDDRYVLEVSRYIHLNPVRANLVKTPQEYVWSSYHTYINHVKQSFVNSKLVLDYFNNNYERSYKEFVERVL